MPKKNTDAIILQVQLLMNRSIADIIRRNLGPSLVFYISYDSWRMAKNTDNANQILNKAQSEISAFRMAELEKQSMNAVNEAKIASYSGEVREAHSEFEAFKSKLFTAKAKFNAKEFDEGVTPDILARDIERYNDNVETAQEVLNSKSENLYKFLESINKKDVFDFVSDYLDRFRVFIDTLSLDQQIALMNIMGYIMVFNAVYSILVILAGNYLIQA